MPGFTVKAPFATVHSAAPFRPVHFDRSFPSNSTVASVGIADCVPEPITCGSGSQISVSSGGGNWSEDCAPAINSTGNATAADVVMVISLLGIDLSFTVVAISTAHGSQPLSIGWRGRCFGIAFVSDPSALWFRCGRRCFQGEH